MIIFIKPIHPLFIIVIAMFSLSTPLMANDDVATLKNASQEMLAYNCAGCHGSDGISLGPSIPTIAGLSPTYLVKTLDKYKNDKIPSTIMGRIAKGYTHKEFEQLGQYYYQKVFVAAEQEFDADKALQGAKLHKRYCERCHSEGGSIQEDDAGLLKGQWKPYLRNQLKDYLNKKRKAPKKMARRLQKLYKRHGYEGIQALLDYYSSP